MTWLCTQCGEANPATPRCRACGTPRIETCGDEALSAVLDGLARELSGDSGQLEREES